MAVQFKRNQIKALATRGIYCAGYCELSSLLRWENRIGYTCGVYGWNCDVYYFDGVVILTGYRTDGHGGKMIDYDKARAANNAARENLLNREDCRELLLSICG